MHIANFTRIIFIFLCLILMLIVSIQKVISGEERWYFFVFLLSYASWVFGKKIILSYKNIYFPKRKKEWIKLFSLKNLIGSNSNNKTKDFTRIIILLIGSLSASIFFLYMYVTGDDLESILYSLSFFIAFLYYSRYLLK